MKSSESTREPARHQPLAGPIEPGPGSSDEREDALFQPRYLDLPSRRRGSTGGRNLVCGVVVLLVSLALLGWALSLSGPRALLPLAVSLLTVVTLFVLARSRLLRQRNGGFLALAIVCLVGAVLALVERGGGTAMSHQREPGTVPTAAAPPEPVSNPPATTPAPLPSLTERFRIASPEAGSGPNARVVKESRVVIDGKVYLINSGEIFPLAGTSNGEVRFTAGDREIALPADAVEIVGAQRPATAAAPPSAPDPMPTSPTELTPWAQREAVRRYPALGVKNSADNQLFIDAYQDLKHSGVTEIFNHADWPLRLAESLAESQGWKRADLPPEPETPAPAQEPRAQEPSTLPEPQ